MAEVRETQVTKDTEGNVLDRRTTIERPRRKGGFSLGLLLGVLIVAGAIVAFAYNQGSFQTAGVRADQATQTAQAQLNQTTSNAQQALNNANNNSSQQQSNSSDQAQPTQTD
jgi:cytoskeletal protein RodZ